MTKSRLEELLFNALAFIDLKLMSEEAVNGGCTIDRVLMELDMTDDEYECIKAMDCDDYEDTFDDDEYDRLDYLDPEDIWDDNWDDWDSDWYEDDDDYLDDEDDE